MQVSKMEDKALREGIEAVKRLVKGLSDILDTYDLGEEEDEVMEMCDDLENIADRIEVLLP